jgi:hypothetical protein
MSCLVSEISSLFWVTCQSCPALALGFSLALALALALGFVFAIPLPLPSPGLVFDQGLARFFKKGERVNREEREVWLPINWSHHQKFINLFRQGTLYIECLSVSL